MKRTYTRYVRALLLTAFTLTACNTVSLAQIKKLKVLFLGNNTTGMGLPMLTNDVARSAGDTLEFDSNTPGGFTLKQHAADPTSKAKILTGKWNYVIFQEQSEMASARVPDVELNMYPFAHELDSLVHEWNPCGRSMYFMTWGFPDGDPMNCPTNPFVCDYNGMDSLIADRTRMLSDNNEGLISPVGVVFKEIMKMSPGINLFAPDRMNASDAGNYAAAVTFYTVLFRKDPTTITFNFTLAPPEATTIRNIVRDLVYDDLSKWHIGDYDPKVGFTSSTAGSTVTFNSSPSLFVSNFKWYFGDGDSSTAPNPVHTYMADGIYKVKLYGDDCLRKDSANVEVEIKTTGMENVNLASGWGLYPNPAGNTLFLKNVANNQPEASFEISNLLGQKVMAVGRYDYKPIDISVLPKGVYLIQLIVSGQPVNMKFVKD
jgi:hypothetical protein